MQETERQKQINKMYISGLLFLGCMCVCLTFGILTAKEIGNYDEQECDEDIFESPWNKIYIGAFIIAGVSLLHVLVICCICDHEKNRRKEVGDCVGLSVFLLWVGVLTCGPAAAFVGNFAVNTRVFNACNRTVLEEDSTKPCFEHLKTHTMVLIVFLVLCFITILWGCAQRDEKHDKLRNGSPTQNSKATQQQHTNQPARSTSGPAARQQQTQQPRQTASFNFIQSSTSSENQENKHNTPKKNQVSTISSPVNSLRDKNTDSSSTEGDYTSEEVTGDTMSDLSIPINHIENHNDSTTNQNIWISHNYYMPPPPSSTNIDVGQNDPYSREDTFESPLPHASVFKMSNHSQQTRRPLPRFKSVATIPTEQPPAYEDLFKYSK